MMWLPETRLAAFQPEAAGPSVGLEIMTPDRTSAQVVDLASERLRLVEARRERMRQALAEVMKALRLQNRYCARNSPRPQPSDNPKPGPGGDAA
jgi:hypothetical protein